MKKIIIATALLLVSAIQSGTCQTATERHNTIEEDVTYADYFNDNTMRYDFHHGGNSKDQYYLFDRVKREGRWAGSRNALINPFEYGEQHFRIVDVESGKTIYKNNYCTLFNEWQTTAEAKSISRSMPEGIIFPEPKKDFIVEIYARNKSREMELKHSHLIKVSDYNISPYNPKRETIDIHIGGEIEHSLDLVLLPDGFTEEEKDKFTESCKKWSEIFFSYEPFSSNKHRINIRAVWAASEESGVSEPGHNKWVNTILGTRFFTFGSERYQMVEDFQKVRDIASSAPYDGIFILTNTQKYGGGGIYNFYGLGSAGNTLSGEVYVHEFGHSLMGLGDEYVEKGNTVSEFYPADKEPWEANLTTFVNFDSKWKDMIAEGTPIPTPYDENMLREPQEKLLLGAYEGGGYLEKGIYRPTPQCMMNQLKDFCPVCQRAISQYLDYICK